MPIRVSRNRLVVILFLFSLIPYFYNLSSEKGVVFWLLTSFLFFYFFLMISTTKNILNPISLLFPFVLSFYYYQFMLSFKQEYLSFETIFVIFSFIISYVIAYIVVLFNKKLILKEIRLDEKEYVSKVYLNFIFIFSVSIFLFECYMTGGFPFIIALFYRTNIYADMYHLPIAHYFVMLAAIVPCLYYHLLVKGQISRLRFYFTSAISFFILLNIMSRQILIMSAIFFFMTYVYENRLNMNKYIIRFGLGIACLFMILGFVRIQSINDDVSQLEYLKVYAQIPKEKDVTSFDVTFNLYTSQNLNTLNDIISKSDTLGLGMYLFQPIIKIFKYDQAFDLNYPNELDSFVRLGTIIADPYLDFNILGVVFFGFIYGLINTFIYVKFNSFPSLKYTLLWSLVSFVMLMSVFTNFYNVLFTWIVFFISISIVKNRRHLL
ncbi:TPA: oligosaccharide repeat unit polymerase [Vibrio campbellii]|nr:oligosaccharide repeat unit polymerase [Vibrio campbellii]